MDEDDEMFTLHKTDPILRDERSRDVTPPLITDAIREFKIELKKMKDDMTFLKDDIQLKNEWLGYFMQSDSIRNELESIKKENKHLNELLAFLFAEVNNLKSFTTTSDLSTETDSLISNESCAKLTPRKIEDELFGTIEFLKQEMEEKNLLIRALTIRDNYSYSTGYPPAAETSENSNEHQNSECEFINLILRRKIFVMNDFKTI